MKPCWTGSSTPSMLEALDGDDLVPAGHGCEVGAGLDRLAVDEHDTGPAVAGVAPPVRAGQPELVTDEVHQQQARLDVSLTARR
jgi:hypothetical protein